MRVAAKMSPMSGHTCYHCKQFVEEGEEHDCWTTTEGALLEGASDDLREAYERMRETAVEFGEQRIYASHHCIMFARKACYFFVRPKRDYLELCVFLGRAIRAPQIKKAMPSSKTKTAHLIRIRHRDEVEAPITGWLREAYGLEDTLRATPKQVKAKAARRANTADKSKSALKPKQQSKRRSTRDSASKTKAFKRSR
jgi:Domain of unknown function (DUF5655)